MPEPRSASAASPSAPAEGLEFSSMQPQSDREVATSCEITVERWRDGTISRQHDRVAEEVPVALIYNGTPHVVMLATPANLEDLAVGFTLSEAIVNDLRELRSASARRGEGGALEVNVTIAPERFSELLRRQRNLTGRTGCGLCGAATVEDAIRNPGAVGPGVRISAIELHAALAALAPHQTINAQTGSVHAAAWVEQGGDIRLVREDVGRHNALDKLIGAAVRAQLDLAAGYFLVTSRASYEMVQKVATVGGCFLAAVSAPTAFAIRMAQDSGLTLVGFAREHTHVVYAHAQRLV